MMMTLKWTTEHCSSTNVQRFYVFNSNGETFIDRDLDSRFRNETPYTAAAVAIRSTGLCKRFTLLFILFPFFYFQFTCKLQCFLRQK